MIGTIVCELTPSAQNPRNSEGAFLALRDGRILFIYTRFDGGYADDSTASLYGIISEDNGMTFSEPFPVLDRSVLQAQNVMSVSLFRFRNGDICLFFLAKTGDDSCIPYLCRSSDEGKTFSVPKRCFRNDGYYTVNNDRILRLSDGRLLMPAGYMQVLKDEDGKAVYLPVEVQYYFSDDDGETWRYSGKTCCPHFAHCTTGLREPLVVELSGGVLWMLSRTGLGRQYEAFSHDGGLHWTAPEPSAFTGPDSPISMKMLKNGRLLAVWNPIPRYNGRDNKVRGVWTGARTPLVMATGSGLGNGFAEVPTVIESDEDRGFGYVAIHELPDGGILLGYCAGGVEDRGMLNRLRIRRISAEEMKTV